MTPVWGWVRDEEGRRLHRKVDHYFQRGPFLCPWGAKSGMEPTFYWHRTLGDIMNGLISCGFQITRVIEPEPPERWRSMCPDRMDGARIPDFLVLVCRKKTEESLREAEGRICYPHLSIVTQKKKTLIIDNIHIGKLIRWH